MMRPTESLASGRGVTFAQIVVLSAWFGLMTAFAEVAAREFNQRLLDAVLVYSVHTFWMTPLADLVLFLSAGVLIFAVGRLLPAVGRERTVLTVLAMLGWASITLSLPRLHWIALLALAGGLAVQTSRLMVARPELVGRVVRPTLVLLMAAALIAGGLVLGLPAQSERRALASLPEAPRGAPNVLMLILDTVRSTSMSLYGAPGSTTPNIDSLAREGVAFDRAIAPASYTLASHASFFTGRWPHELGVEWTTPMDDRFPTLAEQLGKVGYRTAGFSANQHYVTRRFGLARGFVHFDDTMISVSEVARNSTLARHVFNGRFYRHLFDYDELLGRKDARTSNDAILSWLGRTDGRPYFVFANYYEAHAPYLPPAPCNTTQPWMRPGLSAAEQRELHEHMWLDPEYVPLDAARKQQPAYESAIRCLDAAVGSLLQSLERQGRLENTIVVISSDHGEEFGEHGIAGHGNSLYLQSIHVPLVVVHRGHVPAGRRVSSTVSLRDLPATILELAGLPPTLGGTSLHTLFSESAVHAESRVAFAELPYSRGQPENFPVSKGNMVSIVTDNRHYVRDGAGGERVFDLDQDPRGSRPAPDSVAAAGRLRGLVPDSALRGSRENR